MTFFTVFEVFHFPSTLIWVLTVAPSAKFFAVPVTLTFCRIGVDFGQGYVFQRPRPIDAFFGLDVAGEA